MANGFDGNDPGKGGLEEPLLEIDPELNVFALANGLDLLRNSPDGPDRTLEWYREGMERRIVIRARSGGTFAITVGASRGRGDAVRAASRPLVDVSAPELKSELRRHLAEGVERANALSEDDLPPG